MEFWDYSGMTQTSGYLIMYLYLKGIGGVMLNFGEM